MIVFVEIFRRFLKTQTAGNCAALYCFCDAAGGTCLPIVGATSETYIPVSDDVGHALVLGVTAQTSSGSAVAASPATVAVVTPPSPWTGFTRRDRRIVRRQGSKRGASPEALRRRTASTDGH